MAKNRNRGVHSQEGEIYEPTDSEEEYSESEKILLESVRNKGTEDYVESEEELMAFDSSSEDEENDEVDMDSDIDGRRDNDNLPNVKAWGQKRKNFYHTDYVDQDYGGFEGKDAEAAEFEEQEARAIQERLVEQLDEGDFALDIFTKDVEPEKVEPEEETIKTDLTKLTKREKLSILQKESPEFMGLVEDFKAKMFELKDRLAPILSLLDQGKMPASPASNFIKTKHQLILNYCTNIGFYLLLKARKTPIQSHPVVHRLFQYRQLINQLETVEKEVMAEQIDIILEKIHAGELHFESEQKHRRLSSSKKLLKVVQEVKNKNKDGDVKNGLDSIPVLQSKAVSKEADVNDAAEVDDSSEQGDVSSLEEVVLEEDAAKPATEEEGIGKRAITYQITKNKGITPHRKKEQRNPRVKHRMKYRQAKIRRRGQVREPRKELQRYGGEVSGIKAGVRKGIKLKY